MQPGIYRYAPNHFQPWTPEDDALVLSSSDRRKLAVLLGRSTDAVDHRIKRLRRAQTSRPQTGSIHA